MSPGDIHELQLFIETVSIMGCGMISNHIFQNKALRLFREKNIRKARQECFGMPPKELQYCT